MKEVKGGSWGKTREEMTEAERTRQDEIEKAYFDHPDPAKVIQVEPPKDMTPSEWVAAKASAKCMFGRDISDEELKTILYEPPHDYGFSVGSHFDIAKENWKTDACLHPPLEMPEELREQLLDDLAKQGARIMKPGLRAKIGRWIVRLGDRIIGL